MQILHKSITKLQLRLIQEEVDTIITAHMLKFFPDYDCEEYTYSSPKIQTDMFTAEFDIDKVKGESQ